MKWKRERALPLEGCGVADSISCLSSSICEAENSSLEALLFLLQRNGPGFQHFSCG